MHQVSRYLSQIHTRDVTDTADVTDTRDVTAVRDITGVCDVTNTRDITDSHDITAMGNIHMLRYLQTHYQADMSVMGGNAYRLSPWYNSQSGDAIQPNTQTEVNVKAGIDGIHSCGTGERSSEGESGHNVLQCHSRLYNDTTHVPTQLVQLNQEYRHTNSAPVARSRPHPYVRPLSFDE